MYTTKKLEVSVTYRNKYKKTVVETFTEVKRLSFDQDSLVLVYKENVRREILMNDIVDVHIDHHVQLETAIEFVTLNLTIPNDKTMYH